LQEKIICIYCIEHVQSRKKYIGQTKNFKNRISSHKSDLRKNKDSVMLQRAWNKYGAINFIFYSVEICKPEELDEKEIYYISLFDTTNKHKGYNLSFGGSKPPSWLGKKHSQETKMKISKSNIGTANGWLGKKHTDETKEKIRKAVTGTIFTEQRKKKISDAKLAYYKRKNEDK